MFSSALKLTSARSRFSPAEAIARGMGLGTHAPAGVYAADPIRWMVEALGIPERTLRWSMHPAYGKHAWDGDVDPLVKMCTALAEGHHCAVEAGTGTQKTFTAAALVLWFLESFEGAIVITNAPKEDQLTLHIWKEIGRLWPLFQGRHPTARLDHLQIRMRPPLKEWSAIGFPVGVGASEEIAQRAKGFHGEHMLIITEETPGIHGAIMTALENTCTAPHNLRLNLGNPSHGLDELHRATTNPNTVAVRISGTDHPNVVTGDANYVPGAMSRGIVQERKHKYTEQGRLFLSQVRGMCPTEATDALIRWSWCIDARDRGNDKTVREALAKGPRALGVDIANSDNGDRAAIAEGIGAVLKGVTTKVCPDANVYGRIEVAPLIGPNAIAASRVGVDGVGVGAGTINELKRLKHFVRNLNGGESPIEIHGQEEQFLNLRAQMWWQLRIDLQKGEVILPADEELFQDLTAIAWGTRGKKIFVESKDELRARLRRSPDKGDAAVYWNWVRQTRSGITTGGVLV
jgi:hypothetical protein